MSEFTMKCPHCNTEFQVQEAWVGQQASCPSCGSAFMISKPSTGNFPGGQYNQTGAAVPLPGAVPGGQYNQTGAAAPLPGAVPGGQYNAGGAVPGGIPGGQYNAGGAVPGGIPGGQFNPGGFPGGQYPPPNNPMKSVFKLLNPNSPEYCRMDGRASRKEFWLSYLILVVAGFLVMAILGGVIGGITGGIYASIKYSSEAAGRYGELFGRWGASALSAIYSAYIIVPFTSLQIRRLHDSNLSGAFVFLWLPLWILSGSLSHLPQLALEGVLYVSWPLSLFCGAAFLILMLRSGTPGKNRYDEKE